MKQWILIALITLLAVAGLTTQTTPVSAQGGGPQLILTVNSLLDDSEPGGNAGDGVCDVFPLFSGDTCTLRAAIEEINAYGASTGALHEIRFDFSGTTPYVIAPNSALPAITVPVVIDGTTVAGASCPSGVNDVATLYMVLDGVNAGGDVDGLRFVDGSDGSTVRGMVIGNFTKNSGNFDRAGIDFDDNVDSLTFQCNFIGIDWTGATAMPNDYGISGSGPVIDGVIGGAAYAHRNVISGNTASGVFVNGSFADNWVIKGNFIGTDATGLFAIPNGGSGISIHGDNAELGGPTAPERNIISGNAREGVFLTLWSNNWTIVNNYIGVAVNGVDALGNGWNGIRVDGSSNIAFTNHTIGASGQGNVIAHNGRAGIHVSADPSYVPWLLDNVFRYNSIFENGGLGIDLSMESLGDGVTPNDPAPDSDAGPNRLVNFPVLSQVKTDGSDIFYTLSYEGATDSFGYDLYLNDSCDPSGYGEGQTHVYANSFATDGSGVASLSGSFAQAGAAGKYLVATATRNREGTSEFSSCALVTDLTSYTINSDADLPDADTADGRCDTDTSSGNGDNCTLRAAIQQVNASAVTGAVLVDFNIPGGPLPIVLDSPLPAITSPILLDAITQPGASCPTSDTPANIQITLNGNGFSTDGLTLAAGSDGSVIKGLAIIKFDGHGIRIDSNNNTVQCNNIGLERDGDTINGNSQAGVRISGDNNLIGGSDTSFTNIISGNGAYGVSLTDTASGNEIFGNIIGLEAGRRKDRGNALAGIRNFGGDNNKIGGTTDDLGNYIGGNDNAGINLDTGSSSNDVLNNKIGVDVNGDPYVGNGAQGILLTDADYNDIGKAFGGGNDIAGNGSDGILLQSDSSNNQMQDNSIHDNVSHGLRLFNGNDNVIKRNAIHNNSGAGIQISDGAGSATGNRITENSIYDNNDLGIDLDANGAVEIIDAQDADTGANNLQNFPTILVAADDLTVSGNLHSLPNSGYTLEFFQSPTCDASGNGEGRTFLGSYGVTTDGSGNAYFTALLDATVAVGDAITAVAINDVTGDSSEFSACSLVADAFIITHTDDTSDAAPGDGTCDVAPGTAGPYCTLRAAIEEVNALAAVSKDVYFAIEGPGPHSIIPASSLPDLQQTIVLDAVTHQAGAECLDNSLVGGLAVTLDGNGVAADGLTLAAGSDGSVIKGLAIVDFDGHGLRVDSNDNRVQCNSIGLEGDGATTGGNSQTGVRISGDNNLIGGSDSIHDETINIMSDNGAYGVSLTGAASGNDIFGNIIGLDMTRLVARGNKLAGIKNFGGDGNAFGGTTEDLGNTIGGNLAEGIVLNDGSANNIVQNNKIGLDGDGNPTVGNATRGVMLSDADSNTILNNVIAGNSQDGMLLQTDSSNNQIEDNTLRDNGSHGIRLFNGNGNVIKLNAIRDNNGDGIQISDGIGSAAGNQITENSIHDNAGLGVDLNVDGISANDAGDGDGGANGTQNFPAIFSAAPEAGGGTEIIGELDSLPTGTFTVDFYSNVNADSSGYGEGETFLGSMSLSNGDSQAFLFTLPNAVTPGEYITTIARNAGNGDSSEFSAAMQVVHCTPPATFDPDIAIAGSDVQLTWSSPDSADFHLFRSVNDPYFSTHETYDDTQASSWIDPDANELGDAASNYYYTVRGADGCASQPGQTVGEFDFALTPGTP